MRNAMLAELYLGELLGWVDVSADGRQGSADSGGGVTITRPDGDPGTMDLVLANPGGRYSPRNPRSEYHGLLGRNTPVRFGVELFRDTFDGRTVPAGWANNWASIVADAGPGGGSGVDGGTAWHRVGSTSGYRAEYWTGREFRDCEVRVTVDMLIADAVGGGFEPANVLFRMQDVNTYYMARVEVSASEVVTVSLHHSTAGVIAAAVVVAGLTFTGQPLEVAASCVGDRLALKVWDPAAGGEPRDWQLTATDTQLTAAGWVGVRSGVASGNTNTKPLEFRYDSLRVIDRRAHMEVSSWPPRWNTAGTDTWVPVQAAGITRRLGQGNKPPDSALYRYLTTTEPSAYWPLEDPAGSSAARSAVAGVAPMTTFGYSRFTEPGTGVAVPAANLPVFGSGDGIPGSAPVVDLAKGGVLQGDVPAGGSPGWEIQWVMICPRDKPQTVIPIRWTTNGTFASWDFQIESTGIFSTFGTVSAAAGSASTTINLWDGLPHHFRIQAFDSGGNVDARVHIDNHLVALYTAFVPPMAGTSGSIRRVEINPLEIREDEAASAGMPILGHLAVFNPAGVAVDMETAMRGYVGELAADRIERLCAEQGVPVFVSRGPDGSAAMGPQRPARFLELLRECEDADGGILGEAREQLALTYRCLGALYNQTPVELDYTNLAPPLEPTDDDDQVRNDVTVSRPDGGTARSVQTTGPLSVLDPPDGVGVYDTAVTVNVAGDVQLPDQASWRRHVGTWDEARYPRARVELAAPVWESDVDLAAAVTALADGDVVELGGLPEWLPPGPARSMVRGSVERVDEFTRSIDWTWVPAGPYTVATADGDPRIPARGSTLAVTLDATDPAPVNANPYFETDASSWTAVGGTVARSTAQAHEGVASLLLTPDGVAVSVEARSESVPAAAGQQWRLPVWVRCAAARSVFVGIIWRDSGGALLTVPGSTVGVSADTWTLIDTGALTAPALTASVQIIVAMGSTPPAGHTLHIDEALLGRFVTLSLASTAANGPWTTNAAYFPQDLRVGGERVTASGISGGSSPQTVTLSARGVNGVVRAWPAGTEVDVWTPAIAPL